MPVKIFLFKHHLLIHTLYTLLYQVIKTGLSTTPPPLFYLILVREYAIYKSDEYSYSGHKSLNHAIRRYEEDHAMFVLLHNR